MVSPHFALVSSYSGMGDGQRDGGRRMRRPYRYPPTVNPAGNAGTRCPFPSSPHPENHVPVFRAGVRVVLRAGAEARAPRALPCNAVCPREP